MAWAWRALSGGRWSRVAWSAFASMSAAAVLTSSTNAEKDYVNKKREDYLSWDEYFMSVALLSGQRSKDPNTQVGACIVNAEKKIVGTGYNGMPWGCHDDRMPWARRSKTEDPLATKKLFVCHAEMNAILNRFNGHGKDCRIYVSLFPCNECAKLIIQSGIKEVVYLSDKYRDKSGVKASRLLFDTAQVKYTKFEPKRRRVEIDFDSV